MISGYDYLNIGFYFLFIIGVGVYFSRKSANTSDYFRGGGVMPWWITGASAWMAGFSAWTFTGAAGKIYETGPYVLVLYYQNIVPLLVIFFFTCYRFRRLRVVTPMEALRLRFGPATQQFYTWLRLPIQLIFSAFSLNAVSVFMSALFGIDVTTTLVVLGVVVTVISLMGGALGVAASDFVQMILIVLVAGCTGVMALAHPDIGGFTGLIDKVPSAHLEWGKIARVEFIALWFVALTMNTLFALNSLSDEKAGKYMMAASDRHARNSLIIPIVGTIFGSIVWILPPMAAAVLHPNLAAEFPQLRFPNEAAFLAIARDVLPLGMVGLLICCIFAASLTDLGGMLNWGSGLLLRNFYMPILNPDCPEKKLMTLSRWAAVMLGGVLIAFSLALSRYRSMGLFDLLNQFGTSLLMPLSIPAFLGMFFKRTPQWSAWSTALIGLGMAYIAKFYVTPEMFAGIPGIGGPYLPEERTAFGIIATAALVAPVCISWFFFSTLFYSRSSDAHKAAVEDFFLRLRTPLEESETVVRSENKGFAATIGRMCLLYGGFIAALVFIPNTNMGRICYAACGSVLFGVGLLVAWFYREKNLRGTNVA
ncbi:sodium:solute symporter family transporter [Oleiharenicola lentus]|uniref:sodium:solute symporter family transporter n=1 Tax=Oleiharenicola lentus TaxID=2508720 RepID=UPI003F66E341